MKENIDELDWSLKGKGWMYDYYGTGLGLRISSDEYKLVSDDYHLLGSELYPSADIIILRKKLINDIENEFRFYAYKDHPKKYIQLHEIKYDDTGERLKQMINKRFGVDEE